MQNSNRIRLAVSALGVLLAAAPAWPSGDEIEIDPGGGVVRVRNLGAAPPYDLQPGKPQRLRGDVAVDPYQLCYVDAHGALQPAGEVKLKVYSLCDPTKSYESTLRQNVGMVDVVVRGHRLNASGYRCKTSGSSTPCVGNGMPADLWGPVVSFEVRDRQGNPVAGRPSVHLVPGPSCAP